jgi:hypothetical protein
VLTTLKTASLHTIKQIVVRLSLIPAFGTLYQRLMLAESTRFIASQEKDESSLKKQQAVEANSPAETNNKESIGVAGVMKKKAHFKGMLLLLLLSHASLGLSKAAKFA